MFTFFDYLPETITQVNAQNLIRAHEHTMETTTKRRSNRMINRIRWRCMEMM